MRRWWRVTRAPAHVRDRDSCNTFCSYFFFLSTRVSVTVTSVREIIKSVCRSVSQQRRRRLQFLVSSIVLSRSHEISVRRISLWIYDYVHVVVVPNNNTIIRHYYNYYYYCYYAFTQSLFVVVSAPIRRRAPGRHGHDSRST